MLVEPKLIIFDLDGTLIQSPREYLLSETDRILKKLGLPPVLRSELEHHFASFEFFNFYPADGREDFIVTFWEEFCWETYPKPDPFSWTTSTLDSIAELGIKMAIATARLDPEDTVRADLANSGFVHHFAAIQVRPGEHVHWTDKTGQIKAINEALNIPAAETLFIGDVPTDVTSARAVGVRYCTAVLSGGIRRDVLEKSRPDFLFESIHELTQLLKTG